MSRLLPLLKKADFSSLAYEMELLEAVPIDEYEVRKFNGYFEAACSGRTRVATTDPRRKPAEGEVVICYGSFPTSAQALPFGAHIRRNVADYWDCPLTVDRVESASCWQQVDRIVYINLDSRPDRQHTLLRELARGGVPLDRLERFPGESVRDIAPPAIRGALGCLQSHLKVCRHLRNLGVRHGLILEDDFGFCDDVGRWQADLEEFFARGYDYDICLLASSKHGPVEPLDDLVCRTRQPCTNASAYLVSSAGIDRLIRCFEEAFHGLRTTKNTSLYAADRCWASLQGDRFLLFNRKFGYQLSSFSDIESRVAHYLD